MRISDWSSDVCSSDLPHTNQTVATSNDLELQFLVMSKFGFKALFAILNIGHGTSCGLDTMTKRNRADGGIRHRSRPHRSEEHTSELQSLMRTSYAAFCLTNRTN